MPVANPSPFGSSNQDDVRREVSRLRDAVRDLERTIEKQAILLRALFLLVKSQKGITEESLLQFFDQVEVDRSKAPAKKCPECGRGINQRNQTCLYCGEPMTVETAFELLGLGAWLRPETPSDNHGITDQPG